MQKTLINLKLISRVKITLVRDVDNALYINNTDFVMNMSDPHWKPIEDEF